MQTTDNPSKGVTEISEIHKGDIIQSMLDKEMITKPLTAILYEIINPEDESYKQKLIKIDSCRPMH